MVLHGSALHRHTLDAAAESAGGKVMERLTDKYEADAQRKEYERRLANGYPRNIPEERFLRLAAYEDTGLDPEMCANYKTFEDEAISKGVPFNRIVALMEADRAGQLVVLPCKVGQRVFALLDTDKHISECEVEQFGLGHGIGFACNASTTWA